MRRISAYHGGQNMPPACDSDKAVVVVVSNFLAFWMSISNPLGIFPTYLCHHCSNVQTPTKSIVSFQWKVSPKKWSSWPKKIHIHTPDLKHGNAVLLLQCCSHGCRHTAPERGAWLAPWTRSRTAQCSFHQLNLPTPVAASALCIERC